MEDARKVEEGSSLTPLVKEGYGRNTEGSKSITEENTAITVLEQQSSVVGHKAIEEQPPVKTKTKRVATLDAFRGLTIVVRNSFKTM